MKGKHSRAVEGDFPSGEVDVRGAVNHEVLISYICFIGVAALLVVAFGTPMFRISHVTVIGHNLPLAQIQAASDTQGRNIFTIRAANVLRGVRRVPSVLITGVDLSIPAGVIIHAKVREPVLAWQTKNHVFLVDQYGRVIRQVSHSSLPSLRDTTPRKVFPGDYVSQMDVMALMYSLRMLPHAGIERATLEKRRGLVLRSRHGWRALLGHPDLHNLTKRLFILKALLSLHSTKRLNFVNLTLQPPRVSRL